MKNPEEAIERVLTGAREAEAPAGMETRILGALAAHTARRDSRRSWRDWMAARTDCRFTASGTVVAGVCGGVFVVALLVASMHRVGLGAANGVRLAASSKIRGGAEEFVPQPLKPQGDARRYGTAEAVPLSKTARSSSEAADSSTEAQGAASGAVAGPVLREVSGAESKTDYDSLAMNEMLAPSKPAPPLPLTHQEKLLAEVVHKGDPEQVADLEPEVRAKQVEIAKAEFRDFFEPPPVKDNE